MNVPENIMPMAIPYLQIYFLGLAPNLIYNMGAGLLRAVGDSKTPLIFLIISCFINIILDMILIRFLGMGVVGAAIATVTSQTVSAILVITVLSKREDALKLYIKRLHINFPAYGKIDTLFWMTIQSLGISVTTFTGQNFGYGNKDRVKKGIIHGMVLAIVITAIVIILLKLFGRTIYTLFTNDASVLDIGTAMLNFMVFAFPAYITIEVFSGSLRGIGDSWIPMIITASGVCILRIAWVIIMVPRYPNIFTILWAYPLSWITTSILFIIYMFGLSKMKFWLKANIY